MVSEEAIRREITDHFQNAIGADAPYKPYLDDIVRVAHFLANFEGVKHQLLVLNEKFKTKMGTRAAEALTYYQEMLAYYDNTAKQLKKPEKYRKMPVRPMKPAELKHALSQAFADVETLHAFDLKPQIYTKFLSPSAFRAQLKLRRHWKDPTVGGGHGELTHRIQWYCVCQEGVVKDHSVGEIFEVLGYVEYEKLPNVGLWDCVCDRDGGGASFVPFKAAESERVTIEGLKGGGYLKTDFRAPELLHGYLMQGKDSDLTVLSAYIKQRSAKRGEPISRDYVADKLFDSTYAALNAEEKKIVDDACEIGIVTPPVT